MTRRDNTAASGEPTVSTTTPAVETETPVSAPGRTTTTRVKTRTSGSIHGDRVDALRIVAGSHFDVDDSALVRFSAGDTEDETVFNIGVDTDTLYPHPRKGNDVILCGVYTEYFSRGEEKETDVVERVTYQIPSAAQSPFHKLRKDSEARLAAKPAKAFVRHWHVDSVWTDYLVTETLDSEYDVYMQLSTLRELYDGHPKYTVEDAGEYIITDTALIDPDYYETSSDSDETRGGHGKGGNPHSVEYFLENGECPVDECDASFELFRSLKTHVAGKCAHEDADGPHQDLNLRRHEVTVQTETET